MKKKIPFYKKTRNRIILATLVIGGFGLYAYLGKTEEPNYDFVLAKRANIIQEVSVTGRVNPVDRVDLAFQTSGRVESVYVKVGDHVSPGDKLVTLDNADVRAQLSQAQAGLTSAQANLLQYQAALDSQKAKLDEMNRGTRPEELKIAQTNFNNAKKTLEDAEMNLQNAKLKADADLENAYSSALTSLMPAALDGKKALYTLSDIQYANFGTSQEGVPIENAKAVAVQTFLGVPNAGKWTTESLSKENGGVYGLVQQIIFNPTQTAVDETLIKLLDSLNKIKFALNTVPVTDKFSTTDRTNLDTAKANINNQITTLSGNQKAISVQKANNTSSIATAQSAVLSAQNNVSATEQEWKLKRAGATRDQIKSQEALVNQAKANVLSQQAQIQSAYANVQLYRAELEKTSLIAPISGLVTQIDAKVGEIVFPTTAAPKQVALVSLISEDNFEIEANIAEVDVSKVKLGDKARVTLDAYGSDIEFEAVVTEIDPAETMIEGVSTYKVTFQFTEPDERIRSGMTANLDIRTDERKNTIVIPQRAVISKNGDKIVRLATKKPRIKNADETGETIEEVIVKTGLRGSDGQVEILEGVKEGDKVVTLIKE